MKRSDAIKLIKHLIKNTQEDHLAQKILDGLENAGMSPPMYIETIQNDQGRSHFEWESENE